MGNRQVDVKAVVPGISRRSGEFLVYKSIEDDKEKRRECVAMIMGEDAVKDEAVKRLT